MRYDRNIIFLSYLRNNKRATDRQSAVNLRTLRDYEFTVSLLIVEQMCNIFNKN